MGAILGNLIDRLIEGFHANLHSDMASLTKTGIGLHLQKNNGQFMMCNDNYSAPLILDMGISLKVVPTNQYLWDIIFYE